ncbi:MAG: 2-amino-4-hydroxy-6-hydroxymethyldihydropteridine diphosphokinase [Bacteroidales bacterium]|nr:2-amino-4-hydroxy-6-hydroxymethyldihydropteridine diphosphokinase [Bacteroidales bacterium]
METIYLGIGGNLGNRLENINSAINLITKNIAKPYKISSVYLSEPWGFEHAKYFTNAVLKLKTDKQPKDILQIILAIEKEMKRNRTSTGYQGRTMDIDILYYGNIIIKSENLEIPHPKIEDRLFVLLPIKEIDPNFRTPISGKHIDTLILECEDKSKIKKLHYGT